MIALVSSDLRRSNVALRSELVPDLPPVVGDQIQLQQVILNLILNDKDAMSAVHSHPRELLVTSRSSEAGEAVVAVRDSGPGLPNGIDKIFDPFFSTSQKGWAGDSQSVERSSRPMDERFGLHKMRTMERQYSLSCHREPENRVSRFSID